MHVHVGKLFKMYKPTPVKIDLYKYDAAPSVFCVIHMFILLISVNATCQQK